MLSAANGETTANATSNLTCFSFIASPAPTYCNLSDWVPTANSSAS